MPESRNEMSKKRESIFLNERFMGAVCAAMLLTGLVSLYFQIREGDSFFVFEGVTKLVTATAMFLAFKYFKWDVAKGLTVLPDVPGGPFCAERALGRGEL